MTDYSSAEPSQPREWRLLTRVAFRFAACYFLLWSLPFPLDAIPKLGEKLDALAMKVWDPLTLGAGRLLLHRELSTTFNGSGDRTYNWVQLLVIVVLSLAGAAVWSIVDRKRRAYPVAHAWLHLYVRLALAFVMFGYGLAKVIKLQFSDPHGARLLEQVGDMSPMGLLWTFMGASTVYTFFSGLAEMLGGVLLAFRRTALLGALVTAAVMTNIVLLNFAYDVPVKIFSSHLLLSALFVAAPNFRRLADFFVLQRAVPPPDEPTRLVPPRVARATSVAWPIVLCAYLAYGLYTSYDSKRQYEKRLPPAELAGVWNVAEFERDDRLVPPLATDATRWRALILDVPGAAAIQPMTLGRPTFFTAKLDAARRTLALGGKGGTGVLTYRPAAGGAMIVEGTLDGHRIRATLRRAPPFLLTSRGFHWVNEMPFNR